MRNLVIVFFIGLLMSACDQMLKGQQQPVLPSAKGNFFTACGGAVETWANCNEKARKTCQNDYEIISQREDSSGTVRELTFKCKK